MFCKTSMSACRFKPASVFLFFLAAVFAASWPSSSYATGYSNPTYLTGPSGAGASAYALTNYIRSSSSFLIVGSFYNTTTQNNQACYWDYHNQCFPLPLPTVPANSGLVPYAVARGVAQIPVGTGTLALIVGYATFPVQVPMPYPHYVLFQHACYWSLEYVGPGPRQYVLHDIGTLGGPTSAAYGVNGAGQIVGTSDVTSTTTRGFIWSNGTFTTIDTLGGPNSTAYAINNYGMVTGGSSTPDHNLAAYLWTPSSANATSGSLLSLGRVYSPAGDGYYGFTYTGRAITDTPNVIVGGEASRPTISPDGQPGSSGTVGFYWKQSTGAVPTQWGTYVRGNAVLGVSTFSGGRAVGYSYGNVEPQFAWFSNLGSNAQTTLPLQTDMGELANFSEGNAINSYGVVVGNDGTAAYWLPQ